MPSSLPVTIHFPLAEYAKAVTLAVCPSKVEAGVLLIDGMSHILTISFDMTSTNSIADLTDAFPAAARYALSGLIANLLTCFFGESQHTSACIKDDPPIEVVMLFGDNISHSKLPKNVLNDRLRIRITQLTG